MPKPFARIQKLTDQSVSFDGLRCYLANRNMVETGKIFTNFRPTHTRIPRIESLIPINSMSDSRVRIGASRSNSRGEIYFTIYQLSTCANVRWHNLQLPGVDLENLMYPNSRLRFTHRISSIVIERARPRARESAENRIRERDNVAVRYVDSSFVRHSYRYYFKSAIETKVSAQNLFPARHDESAAGSQCRGSR